MRPGATERAGAVHLAVLDLVEHALETAACALMDDFPALQGEPHPWHPQPPDELAARRLLRQMRSFARALRRCRRILAAASRQSAPSSAERDDADF